MYFKALTSVVFLPLLLTAQSGSAWAVQDQKQNIVFDALGAGQFAVRVDLDMVNTTGEQNQEIAQNENKSKAFVKRKVVSGISEDSVAGGALSLRQLTLNAISDLAPSAEGEGVVLRNPNVDVTRTNPGNKEKEKINKANGNVHRANGSDENNGNAKGSEVKSPAESNSDSETYILVDTSRVKGDVLATSDTMKISAVPTANTSGNGNSAAQTTTTMASTSGNTASNSTSGTSSSTSNTTSSATTGTSSNSSAGTAMASNTTSTSNATIAQPTATSGSSSYTVSYAPAVSTGSVATTSNTSISIPTGSVFTPTGPVNNSSAPSSSYIPPAAVPSYEGNSNVPAVAYVPPVYVPPAYVPPVPMPEPSGSIAGHV